jgi:hypothetical protein
MNADYKGRQQKAQKNAPKSFGAFSLVQVERLIAGSELRLSLQNLS